MTWSSPSALWALNIIFKAILDTGDEVVVLAPYFVEYLTYADNHGGVDRVAETDENFQIDLNRLAAVLGPGPGSDRRLPQQSHRPGL